MTWNMDYCFVGDKLDDDMLDHEKDDDKKKSKAAIFVTCDNHKKAFWTHQADEK